MNVKVNRFPYKAGFPEYLNLLSRAVLEFGLKYHQSIIHGDKSAQCLEVHCDS